MAVLKISVAVGADEMVAVLPDRSVAVPLEPLPANGSEDPGPALRQGLGRLEAALRGEMGDERMDGPVRLRVALLPPLSEARLVDLPPLRPEEIEAVLHRIAPRHFLGGKRPLVVGGERFTEGDAGGVGPVFAAAAGKSLVEALQRGVESRGWQLERIVPAHAAWLHALRQADPLPGGAGGYGTGRGRTRLVVAVEGDTVHLVRLEGNELERLRRVPAGDPSAVIEGAGPDPGRALLLAEEPGRADLARALQQAGWVLVRSELPRDARLEAAHQAAEACPELVPPPLAQARRQRSRRLTGRLLAATVLLLVAAAAVHLWGQNRTLREVKYERTQLRAAVTPVLAVRDSLEQMLERVERIQSLAGGSPRWTSLLVELSLMLPRDTYLVSFRGEGARGVVDAVGGRAGETLAALRGASTFGQVRLEGTIQRDLEAGTTSRERFTFSLVPVIPDPAEVGISGWNGDGGVAEVAMGGGP